MRNNWRNAWPVGALLAVVATALANVWHVAHRITPPPVESSIAPTDPVVQQERRLAGLRASLRASGLTGTIGYLGDKPGPQLVDDPPGAQDYYLAQFALAPLVLDLDIERHTWAVASLHSTVLKARMPTGWRMEQDCGAGIFLLRKVRP